LSKKARDIFLKAEKGEEIILVPSIVFAEMFWLLERKRQYPLKFKKVVKQIRAKPGYQLFPISYPIIEALPRIEFRFEMHDLILILTARLNDAPLITKDGAITESKIVKTLW